jgi:hypothetical protein
VKYLCLVYHDPQTLDALPTREWNALIDETMAFREQHQATGRFLVGYPLERATEGTLVRVRKGETSVTDGPYAETKEQLGGFFLIEARDLNEAIQVASRFPPARLGTLEVRPARELEGMHRPAADGG